MMLSACEADLWKGDRSSSSAEAMSAWSSRPRPAGPVARSPCWRARPWCCRARSLQGEHDKRGVRVLTQSSVARIEGDERVTAVVLADGTRLPADVVLVSI